MTDSRIIVRMLKESHRLMRKYDRDYHSLENYWDERANLNTDAQKRQVLPDWGYENIEPAEISFSRLSAMQIAVRIASSPDDVLEIYSYTPWLMAQLFLGHKERGIEKCVQLIVFNLPWYVRTPQQYFPKSWSTRLIFWVAGIVLVINSLATLLLDDRAIALFWIQLPFAILFMFLGYGSMEHKNRGSNARALFTYLWLTFAPDLSERQQWSVLDGIEPPAS